MCIEREPLTRTRTTLSAGVLLAAVTPLAAEEWATAEFGLASHVDVLWTCIAAFLVFFMQAGFALVEAGLTRAKNACNIIMKNVMDLSVGSLLFWMVGFGIMFGTSSGGLFGTDSFFFDAEVSRVAGEVTAGGQATPAYSVAFGWAFLIFQTVFCATAATIVSGAVAGRVKYGSYLLYSIGICAIVYPVFGHWGWGSLWRGEGWLEGMGFTDFAGSTVVHSIGGWAALAGAIVVGARLGKYDSEGRVRPIPGHSIPLAALGVFILWLGWFGFNAGSTTAVDSNFAQIAVNTNIAAAAGAVAAMFASWFLFKKPDTSFALNGALAGLVGVTAGCDGFSVFGSLITGGVCGGAVVFSVLFFDKIRIDDPVGAISVHGVCGAIGTLLVGLLNLEGGLLYGHGVGLLGVQALGVAVAFAWAFPVSLGIFWLIRATVGLRVSAEEELEGLDFSEHGMAAYPGFSFEPGREAGAAGQVLPGSLPEPSRVPVGAGSE